MCSTWLKPRHKWCHGRSGFQIIQETSRGRSCHLFLPCRERGRSEVAPVARDDLMDSRVYSGHPENASQGCELQFEGSADQKIIHLTASKRLRALLALFCRSPVLQFRHKTWKKLLASFTSLHVTPTRPGISYVFCGELPRSFCRPVARPIHIPGKYFPL